MTPMSRVSLAFTVGAGVALVALVYGALAGTRPDAASGPSATYYASKRTLDIAVSLFVLLLSSPILILAGLAVRLDSPGPIFFRQARVGRNGRRFGMLKLRTMRADGDETVFAEHLARLEASRHTEDGTPIRIVDDPRITRVGRVLRQWSIDELPNFWNVLTGSMSLVGPRPLVPAEAELVGLDNPRFRVKPGITGLAQVEGRDTISIQERTRFDEEYVRSQSVSLDADPDQDDPDGPGRPRRLSHGYSRPMAHKDRFREAFEAIENDLRDISRWMYENPEIAYEEHESSASLLVPRRSRVRRHPPGPWSRHRVRGHRGSTGPRVVICCEYDALPEVGHACGHNIIATAAVGAGVALAGLVDELGIRVTVLGTPAEEAGGGKVDLIDAGAFEDVAAAMMVHPTWKEDVIDPQFLAIQSYVVEYHGQEAHAAGAPQQGINALDAFVQAYNNVATLRQQMLPTDRVHCVITHGGGAANVIPGYTRSEWMIRATTKERLDVLVEKVRACFEAAATATGCRLEINPDSHPYTDLRTNEVMASLYMENSAALGRPLKRFADLADKSTGSTDMGNVSQVVPAIHPGIHIDSEHSTITRDSPRPPSRRPASGRYGTVPWGWRGRSSTWPPRTCGGACEPEGDGRAGVRRRGGGPAGDLPLDVREPGDRVPGVRDFPEDRRASRRRGVRGHLPRLRVGHRFRGEHRDLGPAGRDLL